MQGHSCHSSPTDVPTLLTSAIDRLKAHGLKLTSPRQSLLKAMSKLDAPFTTEQVFKAVSRPSSKGKSKFDLVTVYRSLSAFNEAGILSRVDLDDGVIRYEWADPSGHHHHHFVCTSCRTIEPLDLCSVHGPIQSQEEALVRKGYARIVHRLEFYGLCPRCSGS